VGQPGTHEFEQVFSMLNVIFPQIEYKGKGYFSGKSHSFKAVLSPTTSPSLAHASTTYTIEGTWHTTSKLSTGETFHDVTGPKQEVTVVGGGPRKLDASGKETEGREMGEFESRNLWSAVAKGIREGDFETASREKSRIEAGFPVFSLRLPELKWV
jgi:oxysterol-binding protein-related protein 9/10/11